mmetsp:Transcript_1440/g.2499  ORF Transcript_1440/g.2499 Transcript_1440/m.2499 type:complete len:355 (+) Transcript_1440:243-1307(+)
MPSEFQSSSSGSILTGSVLRFGISTLPLLGVLIYFWVKAAQRTSPDYNYYDETNDEIQDDFLMSLMDILIVFLCFHVLWTLFATYLLFYIPKRRRFLGRYLSEGETTLGDVIVEGTSNLRRCCPRRGYLYSEYGYAVYPHPDNNKNQDNKHRVVRKKVRVYQPYTRERVTIVRLPNRPLSGQPKMEIELDLTVMKQERDTTIQYTTVIAILWALFCAGGAVYTTFQLTRASFLLVDEKPHMAVRLLWIVLGFNVPFAVIVNGVRFIIWRNWMMNRGAILENESDARKIEHSCLHNAASADGSEEDVIPYNIFLEKDQSYAGTLPSHSATIAAAEAACEDYGVEGDSKPSSSPLV